MLIIVPLGHCNRHYVAWLLITRGGSSSLILRDVAYRDLGQNLSWDSIDKSGHPGWDKIRSWQPAAFPPRYSRPPSIAPGEPSAFVPVGNPQRSCPLHV